MIKNLPANAGDIRDMGLIPRLGRSLGGGCGNPLQYSCLENTTDRGAMRFMVHGTAKSWTRLKRLSTQHTEWNEKEKERVIHVSGTRKGTTSLRECHWAPV